LLTGKTHTMPEWLDPTSEFWWRPGRLCMDEWTPQRKGSW